MDQTEFNKKVLAILDHVAKQLEYLETQSTELGEYPPDWTVRDLVDNLRFELISS